MKELGVQMIAAYSPQARGRSERSFGTWQGRLPQELRLAEVTTVEGANQFLRKHYIARFNEQFMVGAEEKGTAFRRTSRKDLDWVFTVQTERAVAKDNTVAIADRTWQIDRTRFRHTLAGSTVTIHEHLDGGVSTLRPPCGGTIHGARNTRRERRAPWKRRWCGKRRKPGPGFLLFPHHRGNRANTARFPLFHRADYGWCFQNEEGGSRRLKPKTAQQSHSVTVSWFRKFFSPVMLIAVGSIPGMVGNGGGHGK